MIAASALDLIGSTPLVALDRLHNGPGRLVAKTEFLQPGGSVKDRAARAILLAARSDGRLARGMAVVEMSSGNMGAGLAVACAVLGHPLIVVMSAGNSPERARMLEGLGARVVLVPQVDGVPCQVTGADVAAAAAVACNLAAEQSAFYVDQFNAVEGLVAHEQTGVEILAQAERRVDAWVAAVGSGCSFAGVARTLRAANPATFCAVVEPAGSRPLAGEVVREPRHMLQGVGYGSAPPHWDASLMDASIAVSDEDAMHWRTRLAHEEGLYVGYSAAANVCAAIKVMDSGVLPPDALVVTLLCDTGLKY